MLLSQVLDGSQVTLLAFWEHHGGVMCAERSHQGSPPSRVIKQISPRAQGSAFSIVVQNSWLQIALLISLFTGR